MDFTALREAKKREFDDLLKVEIVGIINAPKKQNDSTISAMDLDPEEELLLCAGFQGGLSIIRTDSLHLQKPKSKTKKHTEHKGFNNIQWCAIDSRMFITTKIDETLTLWDSQKLAEIKSKKFENLKFVHWNQYHSTNPMLAINEKKSVKILDFRVGWEICQTIKTDHIVSGFQWFPSSQHYLYSCDLSGFVTIFDIRSGSQKLLSRKISENPLQNLKINISSGGLETIVVDNKNYIYILDSIDLNETRPKIHLESNGFPKLFENYGDYLLIGNGDEDLNLINYRKTGGKSLEGFLRKPTCSVFFERNNEILLGCTSFPLIVWSTNSTPYKNNIRMDFDTWSDEE